MISLFFLVPVCYFVYGFYLLHSHKFLTPWCSLVWPRLRSPGVKGLPENLQRLQEKKRRLKPCEMKQALESTLHMS